MKKKVSILGVLFLICCFGCATMNISSTFTSGYSMAGLALSAAKGNIDQKEKDKTLTGDALLNAKKLYNQAYDLFIQAGNIYSAYIKEVDPADKDKQYQLYTNSMIQLGALLAQMESKIGGK